jgi:ketosteroid isomerase-like protein
MTVRKFSKAKPTFEALAFEAVKRLFASPFPGQRSHRLHLAEAKYLHGLQGKKDLFADQTIFHAVRYKVRTRKGYKWVLFLIDGYTRVEAILQDLMNEPEVIYLITHTVEDYDEAYTVYCQFNSAAASKRGKHFVQSGVRVATTKPGQIAKDSFESGLLVSGALTSGINNSGLKGKDLAVKTANGFAALVELDGMSLKKQGESSGSMAAYIAILQRDHHAQPILARQFIRGLNYAGNFEADTLADRFIEEARSYHQDRRALKLFSGTANVQAIRDFLLSQYQEYVARTLRKKTLRPPEHMTLGQFMVFGMK